MHNVCTSDKISHAVIINLHTFAYIFDKYVIVLSTYYRTKNKTKKCLRTS